MKVKIAYIISFIIIVLVTIIALFLVQTNFFNEKNNENVDSDNDYNICNFSNVRPNALETLKLPTAYNNSQATHPSLYSFDKEWHGYKYWMAITPYINGNAIYENPHIFASNNLIDWQVPKGLKNPLDEIQDESHANYDSDTHLIFNNKTNQLELFWRTVIGKEVIIYYSSSKNGIQWSDKRVLFNIKDRSKEDMLSPAVIYKDGLYQMWYVSRHYEIEYIESNNLKNWSKPRIIKINYPEKNLRSWHLDVQFIDGRYQMLVLGFHMKKPFKTYMRYTDTSLFLSTSTNNVDYSKPTRIIEPSKIGFDNRGLYRSTFNKINGQYVVIYAGISNARKWRVALSIGPSLKELIGMGQPCFKEEYDKVVN